MARINVNRLCNVVTGDDSTAYRSPAAPDAVAPQITIPRLRARLSVYDAKDLVECLREAVEWAEKEKNEVAR